jgi:poly-gamma-glutamate capsule biosynthesis protein CapA/YwtB (metallophosphatase superfamily)
VIRGRLAGRRLVGAALAVAVSLGAAGCVDTAAPEAAPDVVAVTTSPPATLAPTTEPPSHRVLASRAPVERTRRVSIAVSGDVLVHRAVWESAAAHAGGEGFDFTPMFAELAPLLHRTDLAICHLEAPLSADNTDLSSYPRFNAPFQLADALAWAGFDGCSVASNHVLDQGVAGIEATLGHLDRADVGHAGAARTPEEAAATTRYSVRGIEVAHLSYTYGYNGLRPPAGEDWRSNLISIDAIAEEAARARADGAQLIVLSLHWGDEYVHSPNRQQLDVAAALAARADLDLVVGHHAHVIQPLALVGATPVIYGLGNLLSNMLQPERRDGVVVRATFEAEPHEPFRLAELAVLPTFVEMPGHRIVRAPPESWARTLGHLQSAGMGVTPLELGE